MNYNYSWSLGVDTIMDKTSATLSLSAFTMADAGTYTCMVTNDAGTGMNSVTVLGGENEGFLYNCYYAFNSHSHSY